MQAWSEPIYLPARPSGLGRMTGTAAMRGPDDFGRAPAAGRLGLVAPDDGAGLLRMRAVTDDGLTPSDAELMSRVAAGDEQAFAAVYDRHAQALYGTAMRFLRDPGAAEDLVQETYLAVWTRSESYSPEAGSLIGWLLTIARHRAIDRIRAQSRKPVVVRLSPTPSDDSENDLERLFALGRPVAFGDGADEPAESAERGWVRAVVRTAIAEMPESERLALELAYDDDLTQAEIAERLGWPIGTVKTRTRRALLRLRAMLESVPDIAPTSASASSMSRANRTDPEEVRHGPR